MFTHFIFWSWFGGLLFLAWGFFSVRKNLMTGPWLQKVVSLGPTFFATPLAVFASDHLVGAQFLANMVPAWMPGRLFWAYLVGFALLFAAISIIAKQYVALSGSLLGVMFLTFVLLVHIPVIVKNPAGRFAWAVALRDLSFAGAAWILAGCQNREGRISAGLIATGRVAIAIPLLLFAIEHFSHPNSAAGVPLEKLMPPWIPLPAFWSYLTGAAELLTGVAVLIKRHDRIASELTGLLLTILVLLVYSPMLAIASKPSEMNEAINYIADTLLFAGAVLILADASGAQEKRTTLDETRT